MRWSKWRRKCYCCAKEGKECGSTCEHHRGLAGLQHVMGCWAWLKRPASCVSRSPKRRFCFGGCLSACAASGVWRARHNSNQPGPTSDAPVDMYQPKQDIIRSNMSNHLVSLLRRRCVILIGHPRLGLNRIGTLDGRAALNAVLRSAQFPDDAGL